MKKSNKNKRFGLIALVIVLIVIVGVGYAAASSDSVVLNGNVSAVADDLDIEWSQVASDIDCSKITYKNTTHDYTISATGAYTDADNATMSVTGLKKKGDSATCVYTVKNVSEELLADITCSVTSDVSDTTHYTVSAPVLNGGTTNTASNVAANGGTATVAVTVSLKKAFKETPTTPATYTITCTGTAVESAS